jgi:hypothetical protein
MKCGGGPERAAGRKGARIMPKYRNDGTYPIRWRDAIFEPGEETEVSFFVPADALPGLVKTDDEPPVLSPVLFAGAVTGEMDVPFAPKVTISVQGAGAIYFADDPHGVEVDGGYTVTGDWDHIGKIRVEGSLNVVVERAV